MAVNVTLLHKHVDWKITRDKLSYLENLEKSFVRVRESVGEKLNRVRCWN